MKKRTGLKLLVHACPRCGGSAYLEDPDEDEWRCLQCARSVPSPLVAVRNAPTAA
jgi:hypothetical protein